VKPLRFGVIGEQRARFRRVPEMEAIQGMLDPCDTRSSRSSF